MKEWSNSQIFLAGVGFMIGGGLVAVALHERTANASPAPALPVPTTPTQIGAVATIPRQKTATKRTEFHLRMRQTGHTEGPTAPAGTQLELLSETPIRRGAETLWRVKTPRGTIGWTFVAPSEIDGSA